MAEAAVPACSCCTVLCSHCSISCGRHVQLKIPATSPPSSATPAYRSLSSTVLEVMKPTLRGTQQEKVSRPVVMSMPVCLFMSVCCDSVTLFHRT